MAKNNNTKNQLCGVKFEIRIALNKGQRAVIENAAKRNGMVKIMLPKKEDSFIVVFKNRLKREGFIMAITPYLYGEIPYSYVNKIEE